MYKPLLIILVIVTGALQSSFAQNPYKVIPTEKNKLILGLKIKGGWSMKMQKLKAKEFIIKDDILRPREKYAISKTTNGGYIIHLKERIPQYSKQDDVQLVFEDDGFDVYYTCEGCHPSPGCLVGFSDETPQCTSCPGGGCRGEYLIWPGNMKPVREYIGPSGGLNF